MQATYIALEGSKFDGIRMFNKLVMIKANLIILFIFLCIKTVGQTLYVDFDNDMEKYYPGTDDSLATYMMQLQRPQWVAGVSGKALDLSEKAALRMPVVLNGDEIPNYNDKHDLSVCIWVKTIKKARQGTPVVGNKKDGDMHQPGWSIFTQPNGAWGVNLSDGKNEYTYRPNAPRQAINDGEWHQLAFCLNRKKGEVWFYFDGKNVAIYNTPDLGSLVNKNRTVIGGTDEYWEYGSSGQWTAFNGFIDEATLRNKAIGPKDLLNRL